jgi:hypothetical protein
MALSMISVSILVGQRCGSDMRVTMRQPRPDVGGALYEGTVRLDYEVRHLPGSMRDWDRLVTALSQATDDTVEMSYLELKGALDLATARDSFAVSKAILAFANRAPEAAAPFFDGRAVIVIGVSKGKISGMQRTENHQVLAALRPYLGDDDHSPRWKIERQRVDDQNDVLIIVVDAPRVGDPFFTLRQDFEKHQAGKIFTRTSTESVQADPKAIRMLSRRLLGRDDEFEVEVVLDADAIHRYTWDPSVLEPFLAEERRRYLRQLPKPKPEPAESVKPGRDLVSLLGLRPDTPASVQQYVARFETRHEESRTEAEFRHEVEQWLNRVRMVFPDVVRELMAFTLPPATFTVRNLRGRFLEDLEVEVHIEGPVTQHPKPVNEWSIFELLPTRPRTWGPWTEKRPDYSRLVQFQPPSYVGPANPNSTSFRNSGSVTAVLHCKELRPEKSHTFTESDSHTDVVLLTSDLDLTSVPITATATARGINTSCKIEFTHPVAAPIDVTEQVRDFLTRGHYFSADL